VIRKVRERAPERLRRPRRRDREARGPPPGARLAARRAARQPSLMRCRRYDLIASFYPTMWPPLVGPGYVPTPSRNGSTSCVPTGSRPSEILDLRLRPGTATVAVAPASNPEAWSPWSTARRDARRGQAAASRSTSAAPSAGTSPSRRSFATAYPPEHYDCPVLLRPPPLQGPKRSVK